MMHEKDTTKPKSTTRSLGLTELQAHRDHIQGRLDAPIKLLEYGDYECPYCSQAHRVLKALQRELGDQLCLAYRNFPLNQIHPHAQGAAETAEAAGAHSKFWEMHDLLYENQEALETEDLARYAGLLGLDVPRFIENLAAGTYAPRVREDFQAGVRAGVNGTPTLFINGEPYEGELDFESLFTAVSAKK